MLYCKHEFPCLYVKVSGIACLLKKIKMCKGQFLFVIYSFSFIFLQWFNCISNMMTVKIIFVVLIMVVAIVDGKK